MTKASETLLALANFNSWRRGDETLEMPPPEELGATIDDAVNLLRRYDEMETQLAVNHERAEGIIRARERTIERLREEIGERACPQCMSSKNMSRDMSTLDWRCNACGKRWDAHYVRGWNDGETFALSADKSNVAENLCSACNGEGFVEDPEFEVNACECCGGSGVMPNDKTEGTRQ